MITLDPLGIQIPEIRILTHSSSFLTAKRSCHLLVGIRGTSPASYSKYRLVLQFEGEINMRWAPGNSMMGCHSATAAQDRQGDRKSVLETPYLYHPTRLALRDSEEYSIPDFLRFP